MEALSTDGTNVRERAFRTLLENRVSRNGILSSTGGYLKNGEEGRGLKSRWYPETISKRIKDIADRRDRITLHENVDGRRFLRKAQDKRNYVYFIDPPYSEVGRRLYEWSTVRPHTVFDRASQLKGRFLMTYKNVPQIRLLAERFDFETAPIRMWNGHNARRTELLISNDLSWLY
jgi:DNA adenine methylase